MLFRSATQIFAVAVVMKAMLTEAMGPGRTLPSALATQINWLAVRMSENRIVAGVHFPIDLMGGAVLGSVLGRMACSRFRQQPVDVLVNRNFLAADWQSSVSPTCKRCSTER